jgi:hypothetical protein
LIIIIHTFGLIIFYLLKNKMGKMGKYMVKIKSYVRKDKYNFGYNFNIVKSFFLVKSYARIKVTNIIIVNATTRKDNSQNLVCISN